MAHYEFRDYLEALERNDELRQVDDAVDPRLEVGAIAQRIAEKGGPAIHFKNVIGAPEGATLVGAAMNRGSKFTWSKIAIALGMDPTIRHNDLLEEAMKRLDASVKPLQVKTGVCKENIITGDAVDLHKMLAPTVHGGDGAPCISSWGITVIQEPGSNYVVWDVIPHLVVNRNQLAGAIPRDTQIGKIFSEKYEPTGTPMPFAIVIGVAPTTILAAAFRRKRGGPGVVELAGGLQRAPVHLVNCETSTLMVPATSEMVIEGVVLPGKRIEAGPFSGTAGYRTEKKFESPVWEVRAITHRNKPVLPFATWGVPITEIHMARSLDADLQLKQEFIKRGTPVSGVYTPPWLAGAAVAVGTMVPFTAFSQAIAGIVRTTEGTKNIPYIIVCDNDIDVTNPVVLFHAMVTKCRPGRDTWQIQNVLGAGDAAHLTAKERSLRRGASMILDATWPLDWDRSIAVPPRVSFDQCYPKELQEKVLAEWTSELGFPKETDRPALGA